ncbi:sugar-binding transcriptional regulator [Anaerobacillus sp. MEB173]|uniref:sugar-binding transcriptional regulator n=1 Tax=Anaerobacillus sp. MEB173 TaxID=3383345 RepID=UPI003F9150F1
MKVLLDIQKKLLPDFLTVMNERYRILQTVRLLEPIGRRNLATNLGISERVLRGEADFLKDQGLVNVSPSGMSLTDEGRHLLFQLEDIMKELFGLKDLEEQLIGKLPVKGVVIVPGDSDQHPWVKQEMGRSCVSEMKRNLTGEKIIAVTGGSTLAAVAEMMTPDETMKEALFVPARGGLGEQVENQANNICATMARKALGHYRLLHVPDQLSTETYERLIAEPSVKEILSLIKSASMIVHGIGEAKTMAKRRKSSDHVISKLEEMEAVAEAFGYYFNQSGDIIDRVNTIGLQLEDVKQSHSVIAVAGGRSKAAAIAAYMKRNHSDILITDEAAARELLQIM